MLFSWRFFVASMFNVSFVFFYQNAPRMVRRMDDLAPFWGYQKSMPVRASLLLGSPLAALDSFFVDSGGLYGKFVDYFGDF